MNRRAFFKLTGAAAFIAGVPLALAEPAAGKGWIEYYAASFTDRDRVTAADSHMIYSAFKRKMEAEGLTEIRNVTVETMWNADMGAWAVVAMACMR